MYKQYIQQAIYHLRENRLISIVSVVGTALAICMIMIIVLVLQVQVKDCVPEVNRSRSLYMKCMTVGKKEGYIWANGAMSIRTAKECFKSLTIPEAVAITSYENPVRASVPAGNKMSADRMGTDEAFWTVFSFRFLAGKPYTEADVTSGQRKAVICASIARRLFETTDAVGRTILLNLKEYTVTGVVDDVSKLATASYSQIWVPYTVTDAIAKGWAENTMGTTRVIILARSTDDFPAIRTEVEKLRLKYNATLQEVDMLYRNQPDTHWAYLYRSWGQEDTKLAEYMKKYAMVILILLIVPAINLSSMTLSRMRKRMAEMGVRRAFGATSNELFRQVFWENLILTLVAGGLGLILSYLSVFLFNRFLFGSSENASQGGLLSLNTDMVISPLLFVAALGFCFLLNLLSAGVPSWRVSRRNITDALNKR